MVRRRLVLAVALVSAGFLAAGVGANGAAAVSGSFGGTVKGTNAFVAVVVSSKALAGSRTVLAYVCDSTTIGEWFRGSTRGNRFSLTSTSGARLRVTLSRGSASGTVTLPDGSEHAFAAGGVHRPAGLYRGEKTLRGKTYVGGWIVLPDGRQRGIIKTGQTIVAAPKISDGTSNTVSLPGGGKMSAGYIEQDNI